MLSHRTFAYLPPGLVSPSAVADIKRVVDWFPAAITDCFGFELELMQESSSADFAFISRRNSIGAHILGGTSRTALKKELLEHRVWANVRRFCRRWTADDATLSHNITHIWAEIDMGKQHPLPHPSIFLGVPQNHPSHVEWLLPVLETFDYPVSNAFLRRLEQTIRIPAFNNKNFHIGLMFSRKTDLMRLVFHNVNERIFDALTALGVEDRQLQELVSDLLRVTNFIHLAFDIGESIGPKIGIECQQFSGNIWKDQPRWGEAFHHLVSLGCCTPSKADAILQWPGRSVEHFPPRLIPVLRSINHFKVDWQPGAKLNAKAYLFIQYF